MTGERTIPILPCRSLDDVLPFYEALGFTVSYRQAKPNPYAIVDRGEISLHFSAIDGFAPETSYASVIVSVPDADALHAAFAAGLRATLGRVPRAGIPRLLRPRLKRGTVAGFSVVDPGGNWIRVYRAGDRESEQPPARGLDLAVQSAARLGDSKGDHATAIRMLETALRRHADAPAAERASALAYRAELADRDGDRQGALDALSELEALPLTASDRERLDQDLAAATELRRALGPTEHPSS